MTVFKSEIRDSEINALKEKVRKQDYGQYLVSANIGRIRGFTNEVVNFEFPVTAIIGPNGSGKSAALGAASCAYKAVKPSTFFPKSTVGDDSMSGWKVEYELIDKTIQAKQLIRRTSSFRQAKWVRSDVVDREVHYFGIERTVPAGEKNRFKELMRSTYVNGYPIVALDAVVAEQVEHILGKSVQDYKVTRYGDDIFLVGKNGENGYSEFHFGAGESSIIRMVSKIESSSPNSLILIEELENGLHPVAVRRMVEYLIDAAKRKSIQAIFTSHSDHALAPLPNEAIWACIQGKLHQGKLSVEALRAVSGQIDKKAVIFVEDKFAKSWVDAILREYLGDDFDQVEIHAVNGDGNAVNIHRNHIRNPSLKTKSICILDGDSKQLDNEEDRIIRLPGEQPERTVYSEIENNLEKDLVILTVSCHRPPEAQEKVKDALKIVSMTNRDPHNLFQQLGVKIGLIPETTVRDAFITLWIRNNEDYCRCLAEKVKSVINLAG